MPNQNRTKNLVLLCVLGFALWGCESQQATDPGDNPNASNETKHTDPELSVVFHELHEDSQPAQPKPTIEREVSQDMRPLAKHRAQLAQADASYGSVSPQYHPVPPALPHWHTAPGRENYEDFDNNPLKWVRNDPVSTFSVDVDTASYANVRRMLNQGQLPPADAVRVEEMINYFSYNYPRTSNRTAPFSVYTEMGPSPWSTSTKLLHVGINGWQPDNSELPAANLVFLIDVSGSMNSPHKLGLLKSAMKMMVNQLREQDTVSIAVYAGSSGTALEPTPGDQKAKINAAIDNLHAGGSTNGAAGIHLAYQMAEQRFQQEGVNRVILATDGDFNVGTTNIDALETLVERKRKSGVALTVLGFGQGNYNDHLMQKIAQIGNGNAAYIDSMSEARKVLVEELGATLNIIAKDTKVQIEFNPELVEAYRLVGYETRHLNREDFNNDKVDAGEIGAGHTVTALYEITLVGDQNALIDPLRYEDAQKPQSVAGDFKTQELAFLRLRYKAPDSNSSQLIEQPLMARDIHDDLQKTSDTFRFSAAVAWLGQQLRGNRQVDEDVSAIAQLAQQAKGADQHGYRAEFIKLVKIVAALT